VRDTLATAFGVDPGSVRVLVPFVGGAFGAGLRAWPHVTLAALAARITRRPVKLVLTRAQMFTTVGHRPNTIQQVSVGASGDGQLTAIEHVSTSSIGMADELVNLITYGTAHAYACPNVSTHATQVRQSIPIPGWMRAPGEAEGSFALESAMDELSYGLGIDPIELGWKNHATCTRTRACRGRATRCSSATGWAPNALAGRPEIRSPDRRGRPGNSWDTAWHAGRCSRISLPAKPSQRSDEMERPSFGAARPISDRAPTP
jgi:CO/xanthine dehydrogenase Mo-binding subunit